MKDTEEIEYIEDEVFGNRLLIHKNADLSELQDNIRAARAILCSYPNTYIEINAHRLILNEKNPEYTIDKLIGDRKGVHSEKGVRSSFEKGKKQGCRVIVLDMDMNMSEGPLRTIKLSKEIQFRSLDFKNHVIERCYVVYHSQAACITLSHFTDDKEETRKIIRDELQKIAR